MAAKKTSELVPLCHNIALSYVGVDIGFLVVSRRMGRGKGESWRCTSGRGLGQGDAYRWHQEGNDKGEGKADLGR
jgi:hypothetical protein